MILFVAAMTACAGCSRPSLKAALAQCTVEARRTIGPVQDNDPYIADCMDGRGYEIRAGECSVMESPARVEGCYRPKSAR
jgi:hypothetical protein